MGGAFPINIAIYTAFDVIDRCLVRKLFTTTGLPQEKSIYANEKMAITEDCVIQTRATSLSSKIVQLTNVTIH